MSELDLPTLAEIGKTNDDPKSSLPMQEINEAYKSCKFGTFHIRLLFTSFFAYVAGILVTSATAYLLPSAECDLNMSLVAKGFLNAIPYLGMLFSTVIAGFLTDTFGRKFFLMLGFGGLFICTVIAGSSQTYEVLITAKFLEGVLFATSFNAVVTLTSEFCHNGIRDRIILCQSSFAAFAQILIPAMSWGILTQDWKYSLFDGRFILNTWNFYLYIISLWSLSAFLLYTLFIPESPKFLITQKKFDKARDILIHMYCLNTGKPAESYPYINLWTDKSVESLQNVPEEKETVTGFRHQIVVGLHNVKPMFKRPLAVYLTLICLVNFMVMALYNILRLWFPQLSTIVEHYQMGEDSDLCVMLDSYTSDLRLISNVTVPDVCIPTRSGTETYINSIIIGCVCLLPYFVTGILVNRVGKKRLLIFSGLICFGITSGLRCANSKAAIVTLFSIDIAVAQTMLSLNQALTVEFFPTTTRSLAISLIMVTGRIGSLAGNIAFPVLLDMGCAIPFFSLAGLMICVTLISFFLPAKK